MGGLPARELVRVDEAARYYRVTPRTVYAWIRQERLPSIRVVGSLWIPPGGDPGPHGAGGREGSEKSK